MQGLWLSKTKSIRLRFAGCWAWELVLSRVQLSVFSRVGPLSDLLQTVDSYMRMHAKAQVKTAKPLFNDPDRLGQWKAKCDCLFLHVHSETLFLWDYMFETRKQSGVILSSVFGTDTTMYFFNRHLHLVHRCLGYLVQTVTYIRPVMFSIISYFSSRTLSYSFKRSALHSLWVLQF